MSEAKSAPSPKPESPPEQALAARPSPASEANRDELWPIAELFNLERGRIASRDRRTEIMRHAITASDAADKRQYDYSVEKLRRDDEDRNVGMRRESGSCGFCSLR